MTDKSSKSKHSIVEAALSEFGEYGFAGARTDRIAKRAGVNKQLIYYYFGSKQRLFESVAGEAAARVRVAAEPVMPGASASERLRVQLRQLFEGLEADLSLTIVLIKGLEDDSQQHAQAWGRDALDQIAATVSEGQGLGFFRDDVDPQLAARQVLALLLGYFDYSPVMQRDGEDPAHWLAATTDLLLTSLQW